MTATARGMCRWSKPEEPDLLAAGRPQVGCESSGEVFELAEQSGLRGKDIDELFLKEAHGTADRRFPQSPGPRLLPPG